MMSGAENRGARGAETSGARADGVAVWSPGPAKAAGEPAEAFLLRRASEYPAPAQAASLGLLGPTLGLDGLVSDSMSAAEAALRAADEREALALWSAPFGRVWAMWGSGDLTQPVFLAYCQKARLHQGFAHPWGYQRGVPDWTRGPCCVWEAVLCGLSPNAIRESRDRGLGPSDEVYEDYRQVWRRGAARLSDNWIDAGEGPLRLRAAEALALLENPVRRAPLDRERERVLRSFALASVRIDP